MLPGERPRRISFARTLGFDDEIFVCVDCGDDIDKPVTLDCGHNICLSCFWKNSSSSSCCTSCWEFSCLKTLQCDIVMYPEGEGMCELHQEEQKQFCVVNRCLLCMTCSKLEEHRYHTHWPIAVVALKYRRDVEACLSVLGSYLEDLQDYQKCVDKESPLSWIAECSDYRDMSGKTFEKKVHVVLKYMKGKEKKLEKEELILKKIKDKFNELYQKLKQTEAIQEYKILEQKKEWEANIARECRFLTDTIAELQEKSQKPDLEMLQDVPEILERSERQYRLEPFTPRMDSSYLIVLADFLKFYQRFKLLENCNYYKLDDDKERTIKFITDSSGNTSTIYTTGHLKTEDIHGGQLLSLWSQDRIVDKEGCLRTITIMSSFI